MKRIRLLLAAVAAMVGLSVNAQLTDGTVYWIQDTSTGQFISQGADWGTQATVKDVAGLGFEVAKISEGVYKLKNVMWNIMNNAERGLGSNLYVDSGTGNGSSTIAEVTLTASGDGYTMKIGDNYLCNNGTAKDYTGTKILGSTTDANAATVWKFLTKSEYNAAIQSLKDRKATSLASTLGYNTVTNLTDFESLITDVNQFISKDYTSSITNAALNAGNTNGWTSTSPNQRSLSFNSEKNTCAESWNGVTWARQTVSGIPNGLYKVSFVGTFRPGSADDAKKLNSENTSSPAYVYANDSEEEFIHWIDVAAQANKRSGVVNNAASYSSSFYTYVSDGTLSLGVVQDVFYDKQTWCPFGHFTLTYYTDQVSDEDIAALIATIPAEGTVPATVYSNLTTLKNTLESAKTIAAFNALSEAVAAANALVSPYATLVAEVAKAKALGMEAADADAYLDGFTTPAQATANTQALMVDEYNYVVGNYTVAIDLGTWTTQNAGTMTSQHWDGTTTSSYNEQNEGWNSGNAWSTSYSQTITLPAGEYVFKVAGRHSQSSVLTLSVTEGETIIGTVNDFPAGDTGRGINTSGATDFSDGGTYARNGAGGGWQWRYVPFTLTESTNVTISVVGSNPNSQWYQWCSFCNYTVQAKPSVAASKIAYEQAVANANTALANSTYANVGGTDRSNLETAVAETPEETIEWYDTQKALVDDYLTTFTAGVANWNSYAKSLVAKAEADLISTSICESISLSVPTTAAAAAIAAEEQYTVRELTANYVSTNYTYPLTTVIGDFSTWTATAKYNTGGDDIDDIPQTNSSEHWSGETRDYYEQGKEGWGASHGFNCTYTKTATLPAGNYIVKVAARASGDVTGTISASATANTVTLPNAGATSKGIDLSGAANYGDGEFAREGVGFGWEWRFLPFTLAEDGEVTITIHESTTATHNWFSLADAVLLSDEAKFIPATAEDYANLNTAIETAINTHVYGFEAGEYAPYNNIEAAATIAAAQAIDQTAENSQEDVQAATAAITDATWTVNATEVNAVYDGSFEADYSGQSGNINPTGWQRVKGASADGYNVRYMNGSNAGLAATTSHKALFTKQSAYYGYATGYTMPLKANTMYKITFVYGGWGDCKKDGYVSMAAPDGSNVTLSSTDLPVDATNADADVNAWKSYEAFFTTGEAGDYVLGLRKKNNDTSGQSQYVYGDIVIVKATADDIKPQLLAEITTASAANVTANVGDAAFQIPASAATALTSAISTAQGVYDNDKATIDGVLQAVEDLQAAETAYSNVELNAPADGQLFAVVLTYGGWDYDNKAMTFIAGDRTDQGNYNIKYAAEVNTNLAQAFTFTKVEGNNYTLSQIDAEGNVRYVTDGKTGYNSGDGSGIRTTTDVEKAAAFKIIATSKDGVYNIWNNVKNQFIGSQDAGVYTVNSHIDFKLVETTKPEITINTTAAGYGTTMLPFAVAELPEGVKVYTCDATNGDVLTLTPADAIVANKPYIIEGAWDAVLTGDAQGINLTTTEGLLTGVYAETAAPVGSFVLQNNNGKVGFYRVAEGGQPTVRANHAYLTEAAGARAAYFFGEGVTNGINAIEALTEGNVGIFNAAGVQQPRLQKGLNIVKKADGTSFKVMVK